MGPPRAVGLNLDYFNTIGISKEGLMNENEELQEGV